MVTVITVSGNPEKRVHGAAAEGALLEPRIAKRPRKRPKRWRDHRRDQRTKLSSKNADKKNRWRVMKPRVMVSKELAHEIGRVQHDSEPGGATTKISMCAVPELRNASVHGGAADEAKGAGV